VSLRLYVLDGGTIHVADPALLQLTKEEVGETDLSVACFLVAHPKGVLLWDAGAVPDSEWTSTGAPLKHHLSLPDGKEREITLVKPLGTQLAEVGYSSTDISYIAVSHYHYDHTANANQFSGATWLVRQAERDAMFANQPPGGTRPSTYSALRRSKTIVLKGDEYDVFGDGTVIIRAALGHTPGHQVLYVKLARTGGVVLSGDLYHYPESRTLDRVPTINVDASQTRAARAELETFLRTTKSQLWIQHDLRGHVKLKKAPAFYD
jgi:glyoxylase-like metal-dependent hydrolase (beta-lactamase superfamily II)